MDKLRSFEFSRNSPIIEAWIFSSFRFFKMASAFLGSAEMSKAPELISWSGSILKCLHNLEVSRDTGIFSLKIFTPKWEASAISCIPPATPPSVGSCMACTPPVFEAVVASLTTLILL